MTALMMGDQAELTSLLGQWPTSITSCLLGFVTTLEQEKSRNRLSRQRKMPLLPVAQFGLQIPTEVPGAIWVWVKIKPPGDHWF